MKNYSKNRVKKQLCPKNHQKTTKNRSRGEGGSSAKWIYMGLSSQVLLELSQKTTLGMGCIISYTPDFWLFPISPLQSQNRSLFPPFTLGTEKTTQKHYKHYKSFNQILLNLYIINQSIQSIKSFIYSYVSSLYRFYI